jgi:hypothetical protein
MPTLRVSRRRWLWCAQTAATINGHAFGIVFLKPYCRGVGIRKDLEVIRVSDLLAAPYDFTRFGGIAGHYSGRKAVGQSRHLEAVRFCGALALVKRSPAVK